MRSLMNASGSIRPFDVPLRLRRAAGRPSVARRTLLVWQRDMCVQQFRETNPKFRNPRILHCLWPTAGASYTSNERHGSHSAPHPDCLGGLAASGAPAGAQPLTAREVIDRIKANVGVPWTEPTVDTFKAGDPETPVKGIALTMMATLDVLQRAAAAGQNLVITHEPTFYDHWTRPTASWAKTIP